MSGNVLDALVLEDGKSAEVRAALDCLRDASAADGGPRYSDKVCRDVARAVVCRTYAKPILELSHMIVAASAAAGRYEDVFWGVDRATAVAFHRRFRELGCADVLEFGERSVTTLYGDGRFEIAYGRMPFLSALLEFLVGTVGYADIDAATTPLRLGARRTADVSAVASDLSKRLYEFLKAHLPSIQTRKRERHFLAFVSAHRPEAQGADAIDDDIAFVYWRAYATNEEVEARAYRTVHETASRLILALEAATSRLAATRASSIGADRAGGEVDPADVQWVSAALDEDIRSAADVASVADAGAKLATKTELDVLAEIPAAAGVGRRLPRSILRAAVFGLQQNRIGNAKRHGAVAARIDSLSRCDDVQPYAARAELYRQLARTLRRVQMAGFHLLHRARHPAAVDLALHLAPDAEWGVLLQSADVTERAVVPIDAARATKAFFDTQPGRGNGISRFLAEARDAARKVSRQGIDDESVTPEKADSFVAQLVAMANAVDALERFVDRDTARVDLEPAFTADKAAFVETFTALYCQAAEMERTYAAG